MKAQSISVNLRGPCDAACPFCISRLTWKTGVEDNAILLSCLRRALEFARFHSVDTVLITGSGEPTLLMDDVVRVVEGAKAVGIPLIELQTNGRTLYREPDLLSMLADIGLTTIAVSMADPHGPISRGRMWPRSGEGDGGTGDAWLDYEALFGRVRDLHMLCRISLNLVAGAFGPAGEGCPELAEWADGCRGAGVHQLSLRELGVPSGASLDAPSADEVREWVRGNAMGPDDVRSLRDQIEQPARLLRHLPFGVDVYDYRGLSTCLLTCMTDNSRPDEIRSLILQPDGHVYHSWNYTGSVLL